MRPFTSTIDFDEALRRVLAAAAPIERTIRVPIDEADGRVFAGDIVSDVDVPPFDRATMDGYAVIAADTRGAPATAATLRLIGRVLTGEFATVTVTPGTCAEIATGAPMPAGADAVVMVESTERAGEFVRIMERVEPGQQIGRRGADIARGHAVARDGDVLTPARVGALAAIGATDITAYARPTVAILSTGNEITAQGTALGPGHVYDVNGLSLSALVRRHGGAPQTHAAASDSVDDLVDALDAMSKHDLIVFSGGSSVGESDLVRDAVAKRGEIIFHGIAVRPGKPTLFARMGRTLIFGMPGNPTSCLSNGYILLVPLLRAIARLPPWTPQTVHLPLARAIASVQGRLQFYTVRIVNGEAHPVFKGSGAITSMAEAEGYIEIAADVTSMDKGTVVTVKLF